MLPKTPRVAANNLITALCDNDLKALMTLYEEDATLVVRPGMLAQGTAAIRTYYEGLFTLKPDIKYDARVFTETADLALFTANWTILNEALENFPVNRTNCHVAIMRKQPDGNWLIAVDNPWGPEPPPKNED